MSEEERLKRLEAQVAWQEHKISSLQKQIELLQQALHLDTQAPVVERSATPPKPKPPTLEAQVATSRKPPAPLAAEPSLAAEPLEPVDLEHLIGRVWLPRIFILVLLVGVLWGFKAAVNAGYLTEPIRCLLGVVASGALIWLGERQIRNDRVALGQVLLGGAVSLLVLTTFAAHVLYGLIGTMPAFGLNVLTVVGGVWLAHRHRSEALAILASVGGFLVPFLVESAEPNTLFFIGYEAVTSAAFLMFAWRNGYLYLHYVSLALFHLTAVFFSILVSGVDEQALAYGVLAHHGALLLLVLLRRTATDATFSYVTLYTSAVVTISWWYELIYRVDTNFYKGFLLSLVIVYALLALWRRQERQEVAVYSSVALFTLMIYLFNQLAADYEAMALLVEGTITLWLAYYLKTRLQLVTGAAIYLIGFVMTLFQPFHKILSTETLTWVVLLASVLVLFECLRRRTLHQPDEDGLGVGAGYVQAAGAVFAVLLLVFLTMMTDVLSRPLSRDGEYMAVSFVWGLYAIVAIIFGTMRNSSFARLSGVILLFVTLLKLIFVDLPTVSVAVRAILFIGLGAVGVGISRLFYQKKG